MQTAHHHHLSGLTFPYNLNLAAAAPPLCHGYSLIFNATDNSAYYQTVKPSPTTAERQSSSSSGSTTDDDDYASDSPKSTLSSSPHNSHLTPSLYSTATVIGYPSSLPVECAAMMPPPPLPPNSHCQRQNKRLGPSGNIQRGGGEFSKPFTIEAILGLENGMVTSQDSINNFNNKINNSTKVGGQHGASKHFIFKKSGKEFRRNLNVRLTEKVGKSKRVRTIFTPEQLERLENEFERQQYMVGPERLYLASSLNLAEAQVKVWFQNRRIKWRKHHLELQQAQLAKIRETGDDDNGCQMALRQPADSMPRIDEANTPASNDNTSDEDN